MEDTIGAYIYNSGEFSEGTGSFVMGVVISSMFDMAVRLRWLRGVVLAAGTMVTKFMSRLIPSVFQLIVQISETYFCNVHSQH